MDRVGSPEPVSMRKLAGAFSDASVELHDDEIAPSPREIPDERRDLFRGKPLVPASAREGRMALDERQAGRATWIGLLQQAEHSVAAGLREERLHESTGVQIERQPRSSLM